MNIIWAFIFTTIVTSQVLQASQSDAPSDKEKSSTTKNTTPKQTSTKGKQPAQKAAAPKEKTPAQKQPAPKEKTPTSAAAPAQKKLKPSAASTAALLKHSATPGYVVPFEKIEKPSASNPTPNHPILKKNLIFPTPAKVQNLGNVEIGNSSMNPITISSITFSYTSTSSGEKDAKPIIHTRTHKITFPRAQTIPAQKKLAFTITMKNHEPLQFAGIKSIQTHSQHLAFDPAITDLSKPIVLKYSPKGKILLCI